LPAANTLVLKNKKEIETKIFNSFPFMYPPVCFS